MKRDKGVARKTNPSVVALVTQLQEKGRASGQGLWRDIAERLEKPTRRWAEVNVEHVEQTVRDGEIAVVPGKLLGDGVVTKKLEIAAWSASASARAKVEKAGGKVWSLNEFAAKAKDGRNVRIVG